MKKNILLFILLFTSVQNFAQHNYIPIAVENAQWIVYVSDADLWPPFLDYYFGYKIEGDIEINNIIYKKVYYRNFTPVNPDLGNPVEGPFYIENEFLFGAIRDDIPNKKVYAILFSEAGGNGSCINDEEFLLYDFSMLVGDSYDDFCIVEGGDGFYLEELTTEYLFGENRLVQTISDGWGWIYEGIGGDAGLFYPVFIPLGCPCAYLDYYCIGSDEECLNGFLISSDEYLLQNKINIYPNPVGDVINIASLQGLKLHATQVYDLYGKLLIRETNNLKKIDISNLTDGLYILQVNTELGNIFKKILKKSSR